MANLHFWNTVVLCRSEHIRHLRKGGTMIGPLGPDLASASSSIALIFKQRGQSASGTKPTRSATSTRRMPPTSHEVTEAGKRPSLVLIPNSHTPGRRGADPLPAEDERCFASTLAV